MTRDNITEKAEKIMFGKFVSLYLCPGVKKSVKTAHRGSLFVRWVLFFIGKCVSYLAYKDSRQKKSLKKRTYKWKNVEILCTDMNFLGKFQAKVLREA